MKEKRRFPGRGRSQPAMNYTCQFDRVWKRRRQTETYHYSCAEDRHEMSDCGIGYESGRKQVHAWRMA